MKLKEWLSSSSATTQQQQVEEDMDDLGTLSDYEFGNTTNQNRDREVIVLAMMMRIASLIREGGERG